MPKEDLTLYEGVAYDLYSLGTIKGSLCRIGNIIVPSLNDQGMKWEGRVDTIRIHGYDSRSKSYPTQRHQKLFFSKGSRPMCFNSPYLDHLSMNKR